MSGSIRNCPYLPDIGNRIKAARKANKCSRAELAETIGIDVSMMSRIENDRVSITVQRLAEIARALNVDIKSFL